MQACRRADAAWRGALGVRSVCGMCAGRPGGVSTDLESDQISVDDEFTAEAFSGMEFTVDKEAASQQGCRVSAEGAVT